jgi:hypothetical protein
MDLSVYQVAMEEFLAVIVSEICLVCTILVCTNSGPSMLRGSNL